MRKIAKLKWNRDSGEYSKKEFEYVGLFHRWVKIKNKLSAVIEHKDGYVFVVDVELVRFIDDQINDGDKYINISYGSFGNLNTVRISPFGGSQLGLYDEESGSWISLDDVDMSDYELIEKM